MKPALFILSYSSLSSSADSNWSKLISFLSTYAVSGFAEQPIVDLSIIKRVDGFSKSMFHLLLKCTVIQYHVDD